MEKKILLATILTVAIAVFLTVYWLLEPYRVKMETERMGSKAAAKGKTLYMTHCARCHGEKGGPRRGIRPINSKDYLKNVDDTILYKIIERGIPGTGMVALADKEGGPLNPEQIRDLVAFIRSWEKTAPTFPAEEAPPKTLFFQEESAYVGSESCIGCHGDLNKEKINVWKKSLMATKAFALIKAEKDKTKCIPCHATGYDPEKKTYKEENVGCEACHGPGEKYQEMMMGGANAQEGGKIAKENALKSCTRCHHPHTGKEEHVTLARKGLLSYP